MIVLSCRRACRGDTGIIVRFDRLNERANPFAKKSNEMGKANDFIGAREKL